MRKENSRQHITLRAVIIGIILIPLNNYWVMMTEVKWYVLQGTSIPLFVRPIFMLFLIIGLNLLLKKSFPKVAMSEAELLIISISQTRVAEVPDFGGYPTKNGSQGLPLPLTGCGFIFGFRCTDYLLHRSYLRHFQRPRHAPEPPRQHRTFHLVCDGGKRMENALLRTRSRLAFRKR